MSRLYYRPLPLADSAPGPDALPLAGGWCRFDRVAVHERGRAPRVMTARDLPGDVLDRLTAPRAPLAGLSWEAPRLMGILNVTPDSFSDGGRFADPAAALAQAKAMADSGAAILDIGGESTRPGARPVPAKEEIARTAPVIAAIRAALPEMPLSIDTRKAAVARAALDAGAGLVNDVSALTFDAALGPLVAERGVPVCLMHSQGTPETMQDDPRYDDVLLDVYDALDARIAAAEALGIPRSRILVDPGIGFGKTLAHNLALLRGIALFHGLGCPILLGVSRKGFIGVIGNARNPADRLPGSIALALAAIARGVQLVRVHDMAETAQALALWQAVHPAGG